MNSGVNATLPEPDSGSATNADTDGDWSFQRRWLTIFLVFAAHVGLVFAVASRKAIVPRPPPPALELTRLTDSSELLALLDPTLFALPNIEGYAGQTWMKLPAVTFPPFHWTEPPRLLALPVAELGAGFAQFQQANTPPPFEFDLRSVVAGKKAVVPFETPSIQLTRSTLTVAGEQLEGRRLLNSPELRAWPALELLTNSVVRTLVGADGRAISAALVSPGSGSPQADEEALNLAWRARFAPARAGAQSPVLAFLIFEWQTVPRTEPATPEN